MKEDKLYAVFCLSEEKCVLATSQLFRDEKDARDYAYSIALEKWALVWDVSGSIREVSESLDRILETKEF